MVTEMKTQVTKEKVEEPLVKDLEADLQETSLEVFLETHEVVLVVELE
jgi:hypothetical protein